MTGDGRDGPDLGIPKRPATLPERRQRTRIDTCANDVHTIPCQHFDVGAASRPAPRPTNGTPTWDTWQESNTLRSGSWQREPGGAHIPNTNGTPKVPAGKPFLTRDQLAELPKPRPVIDHTIDGGTVFVIAGYYGTLKSFIVLDWCGSVITGTPWQRRDVKTPPRRCLYVVGEGAYGINARLNAWESWNGQNIPDDMFLTWDGTANLSDTRSVTEICATVRGEGVEFVVFDTLAKAMPGMDENSARDMGVAVASLYQVLASMPAGGVVGAAHHTGKDRATIRGSSALENGVDTVYLSEGTADNVTLKRTKRKDGPTKDELSLYFSPVDGTGSGTVSMSNSGSWTTPSEDTVLSKFVQAFSSTGAPPTKIIELLEPMPRSTVYLALNALHRKGKLRNEGTDRRPHYMAATDE